MYVILIYISYAFPWPRYGHDTSNIVESLNKKWGQIRFLPPLLLVDAIYTSTMKMVYDRCIKSKKQHSDIIADIPYTKFVERQKRSKRYKVFESGNGIYQVQNPDSGQKFVVNLKTNTQKKCECTNFYEYQAPCLHAIIACRVDKKDPFDCQHFLQYYRTKVYQYTYSVPMLPISITELLSDPQIKPPTIVKQRGRPKSKRIRKGDKNKREVRCGNCGGRGHNKRSCRGQPRASGRRARNWVGASDNSGSDSEDEFGIEQQMEADLLEYNAQVARAWEIANRLEDEKLQRGQDSDSDLSSVGIGQFEGFELRGDSDFDTGGDRDIEVAVEATARQLRPRGTR
jgi:hypothetical protein